jgi:hypothetical protein
LGGFSSDVRQITSVAAPVGYLAASQTLHGRCWMVDVAPPSGGLIGNSNYVFYDNGNTLQNVAVTVDITEDLTGNIGFGLQLNAYSPAGANSAWQQFFSRCNHPAG